MRKQVIAAADWTRRERERLAWSAADLVSRIEQMASDMGWRGAIPTADDIEALEAQGPKQLPRWFKLVRYAVERSAVPDSEAMRWLAERNSHWQPSAPLRMSRPLMFEDEERFVGTLDGLDESERRAIRAFVADYADRQCYASKEAFARQLLKKLGIATVAVVDPKKS